MPVTPTNPSPKKRQEIDWDGAKKYVTYLKWSIVALIILLFFNPIVVVDPGNVGVVYNAWSGVDLKSTLGPGWHLQAPILQSIYTVQTARDTINLMHDGGDDIDVSAPTKEGLVVNADVSVFFRVPAQNAPVIVQELTPNYRYGTLIPIIRSAAREVAGQMAVSDLYGP